MLIGKLFATYRKKAVIVTDKRVRVIYFIILTCRTFGDVETRDSQGRRRTFRVGYSKIIEQGVQLWLYFNVFRKSDL